MDNIGCLNTKTQNDLITNYIAQYPKGTVVQKIYLTDTNYFHERGVRKNRDKGDTEIRK